MRLTRWELLVFIALLGSPTLSSTAIMLHTQPHCWHSIKTFVFDDGPPCATRHNVDN